MVFLSESYFYKVAKESRNLWMKISNYCNIQYHICAGSDRPGGGYTLPSPVQYWSNIIASYDKIFQQKYNISTYESSFLHSVCCSNCRTLKFNSFLLGNSPLARWGIGRTVLNAIMVKKTKTLRNMAKLSFVLQNSVRCYLSKLWRETDWVNLIKI